MEIEVGEYVRYDDGSIVKVVEEEVSFFNYVLENKGIMSNGLYKTIVKHSKNIIDLIEVGDYVNNCKVLGRDKNSILLLTDNAQTYLQSIFEDKYIKTILTHEQFEQNCYRLEENNV